MKPTMRQRLRDNYRRLKCRSDVDVQSNQILALMEIVEVLERRVDTLEALEIQRQGRA